MKAMNISAFTDSELDAMKRYLHLSEKFKNVYFFKPATNAQLRRKYEAENSFEFASENIVISFNISCSCNNIRLHKRFLVNGLNKNCTFIKKIIK